MRRRVPYYLCALLFATGFAGVSHADPDWPNQLGLDVWNIDDLNAEMQHQLRLQRHLEALDAIAVQRIHIKDGIIQDLLDRQITLFEAAGGFIELNRGRREVSVAFRAMYAGMDEAEATCRNVIEFVRIALQDDPHRQREELQRLSHDLEEALHAGGGVRLP